jgi:hypothetical protein
VKEHLFTFVKALNKFLIKLFVYCGYFSPFMSKFCWCASSNMSIVKTKSNGFNQITDATPSPKLGPKWPQLQEGGRLGT